jgi:hypothetical protein
MTNSKKNQRFFDLPSALYLITAQLSNFDKEVPGLLQEISTAEKLPQIIKALQRFHSSDNFQDFEELITLITTERPPHKPLRIRPKSSVVPNEFYSIFDLENLIHLKIDDNIRQKLGIEPQHYNIKALAGLDPQHHLYHSEDVQHVIRWVSLAFVLIKLNLFKWRYKEDLFRICFRAGTSSSSVKEIRDAKYMCLEKSCVLINADDGVFEGLTPHYLLNKTSLLPASYFNYVKLRFVSSPKREAAINTILYLFNIALLDIPLKHLILLQERANHKNMAEATSSLNKKIFQHHRIDNCYTEKQFSDTIQKTIRLKISQAFNLWSRNNKLKPQYSESDMETIEFAKRIGLIPIPPNVYQSLFDYSFLIYK